MNNPNPTQTECPCPSRPPKASRCQQNSVVSHKSQELTYTLEAIRDWPRLDVLDLSWVALQANNVSQKWHRRPEKVALGRFQLSIRSEPLEYQGQIGQCSIKSRSEGDDIIQVHEAARRPEALENPIHQALECGRRITKAEGHNPELEQTGMCRKRCLDQWQIQGGGGGAGGIRPPPLPKK